MQTDERKRFNRELLTITIPLALQNLLNALVGASDALMLGRLTQDAIAAVSLANQISFVMSLLNGSVIGAEYLQIVSFSYLFIGVSQCFLMMMKISGHAKMSVCISAVTVAVDMAVDFFLIYGIGPVPALGANGSAYSTIAVEAIALIWCLIWSSKKREVHLDRKSLFFSRRPMKRTHGGSSRGCWQAAFPGD